MEGIHCTNFSTIPYAITVAVVYVCVYMCVCMYVCVCVCVKFPFPLVQG